MVTRDVCVLGLGYVGLPLACAAAEAGHRVIGYDPDRDRVAGLRRGRSPVEDVEDRMLEKALASGRLSFADEPAEIESSAVALIFGAAHAGSGMARNDQRRNCQLTPHLVRSRSNVNLSGPKCSSNEPICEVVRSRELKLNWPNRRVHVSPVLSEEIWTATG